MRLLCRRIDAPLHPACGVLTHAIGIRPGLLQRPRQDVLALFAQIPDPVRRAARISVFEHGVDAPEFDSAMREYLKVLDEAERLLSDSDWLAGDGPSLADFALLPYVLRFDHLALAPLLQSRSGLARWYAALRGRSSWSEAIDAWAPEPLVTAFRASGAAVAGQVLARHG